jgi:bifunctional polynucleotide phosphatase/kinase
MSCHPPRCLLSNILKQREKCIKMATAMIEGSESVVVGMYKRKPNHAPHERCTVYVHVLIMPLDNTNADPETRAVWVNLARKFEVPIRCVLFTASAKVCEHNDTVRALNLGPEVSFPTLDALRHAHE